MKHYTTSLPHVGSCQGLNNASTVHKASAKDTVRVLEHAVLQTDDDELRALEPGFDKTADILRVGQVERSVNFVQNIHWRRLEL